MFGWWLFFPWHLIYAMSTTVWGRHWEIISMHSWSMPMVIKDPKVLRELEGITCRKYDRSLKYLTNLCLEDALYLCCVIPKGRTWSYKVIRSYISAWHMKEMLDTLNSVNVIKTISESLRGLQTLAFREVWVQENIQQWKQSGTDVLCVCVSVCVSVWIVWGSPSVFASYIFWEMTRSYVFVFDF